VPNPPFEESSGAIYYQMAMEREREKGEIFGHTLWLFNIAIENVPFFRLTY
jgi:hypothetical protein